MDEKLVRYTLRVDRLLFKKFRYIAESEGLLPTRKLSNILKRELPSLKKKTAKSK